VNEHVKLLGAERDDFAAATFALSRWQRLSKILSEIWRECEIAIARRGN